MKGGRISYEVKEDLRQKLWHSWSILDQEFLRKLFFEIWVSVPYTATTRPCHGCKITFQEIRYWILVACILYFEKLEKISISHKSTKEVEYSLLKVLGKPNTILVVNTLITK